MASKFQNRLVGTVILVAIGVIVLPGLLDGKKKHYKEEFAAIPLVPKPGDQQDNDLVPPVTQPLAAAPAASAAAGNATSAAANAGTVTPDSSSGAPVPAPSHSQSPMTASSTAAGMPASSQAEKLRQQQQQQQQQAERQRQAQLAREHQAEERARQQAADTAAKAKARQAQQERERERALQALNDQSSAAPQPQNKPETPSGQAWVIQLGALKNAARVSEIVAQLRSAGFRAYSLPAEPVQGEINRILVGPDSSKSHLQSQVAELKSKTGLSGVIRPYSAR